MIGILFIAGCIAFYFYTKYKSEVESQDGTNGEFHVDGITPKFSYTKLNGKLNGEWKSFYATGVIKEIKHYSFGLLDGDYIKYSSSAEVEEKGTYNSGNKIGRWETFYENGDVKSSRYFNDGIEDKSYYAEFNIGAVTHMTKQEIESDEFQDYGYTNINNYNNAIDEIERDAKYTPLERIYYESKLPDQLSNDISIKLKTQEHINHLKSRGIAQRDIGCALDIIMTREEVIGKKLDFEEFVKATIEYKGKFIAQEIYEGLILIYETSGRELVINTTGVYNRLFLDLPF